MGRILALDVGSKRVGIAVSDPGHLIATPLAVIAVSSYEKVGEEIVALCSRHEVETVVVGLPLRDDGSEGASCKRSRRLGRVLKHFGLAMEYWDERDTSRIAESVMREGGKRRRNSPELVDKIAAAIILKSYLESIPKPTFD